MFTIHLHNLRFFSFHGIHEEEQMLGNDFEVSADVTFNTTAVITHLQQTINYVKIYEVIKQRMNTPTALLETVAQDLAALIYQADNRVNSINIHIKKIYPPIANFTGSVGVSYKKDF